MKILILGSGAWGTSLAQVFAKNDNIVKIWSFEKIVAEQINNYKINKKYLNRIKLSKNISSILTPSHPKNFDFIFYVSPAQNLLSVLSSSLIGNQINNLIICSKGIDISSGDLLSDIVIKNFKIKNIHVLSGPSFAREIASGLPAALSLGSQNKSLKLERLFYKTNIRVYLSKEYRAIQLLGSLKNTYAIGSGIIYGLQLGENARAAYLTRVIKELKTLMKILSFKQSYVESLAGIGDLILTCSSEQSRNFKLGTYLAKNKTASKYVKKNIQVNEGFFTALAINKNSNINLNELPILKSVVKIINGSPAKTEVKKLLSRPFKDE